MRATTLLIYFIARYSFILTSRASTIRRPPEGFEGAVAAGAKKAAMPPKKIFGLGVLSGCHIGFGAFLMLSIGGAWPRTLCRRDGFIKVDLTTLAGDGEEV